MTRFALRGVSAALGVAVLATTVAGCTTGSDGNSTPSITATVTATTTASSTSPATPATTPSAATTGGGSTGAASGTAGGPGLCTPTVTTFSAGRDDGAAGSQYFEIVVTNASQRSCVTTGFPGIALLDAGGRQILQAQRDTGGAPPATIVLQPGEQASTLVRASDIDANGGACPTSPAFLFTLPDNTDSTTITHSTPACSVDVAAFVRGTGPG